MKFSHEKTWRGGEYINNLIKIILITIIGKIGAYLNCAFKNVNKFFFVIFFSIHLLIYIL